MLLAHLSDLHLGHRSYDRVEGGRNVRETDVAQAFQRAVQEVVRLEPDLVFLVGDIFDRPDPPPGALVALARGLEAIRSALPDTQVFMVAGARDTPRREGDPGALAALDPFPRVEAVTGTARSVYLRELDTHLYLVPHSAVVRRPYPEVKIRPEARWNLLLAHAGVGPEAGPGLSLDVAPWDYVALGYRHQYQQVASRSYYPGSLERVGPEPWREAGQEKGFLTFDLEDGASRFHPIPGRAVVSLAPIRISRGQASQLPEKIEEVLGEVPGGIEDKIVRLRIEGLSPGEVRAADRGLFAPLREETLHLAIEVDDFQDLEGNNPLPLATRDRGFAVRELRRSMREGEGDDEALRLLDELGVGGDPDADEVPEGKEDLFIRGLHGTGLPFLGTLDMEPGEGLLGWVGSDGRMLRSFVGSLLWAAGVVQDLEPASEAPGPGGSHTTEASLSLRLGRSENGRMLHRKTGPFSPQAGEGTVRSPWGTPPGLPADGIALAWAGRGGEGPERLLDVGSRLLASARGTGDLESLRDALLERFPGLKRPPQGRDLSAADYERLRMESELEDVKAQLRALEGIPDRVARLEGEIRDLRVRAIELNGDLEADTMDWHRERQDAETHLQAYRDRARELRRRIRKLESLGPESPCPTCGRLLEETARQVLAELNEEWEGLVQDGRWWRRRWEQLETKPQELRDLEGEALRLNAGIEERTERLERARSALREMDELRVRMRELRSRLALLTSETGSTPGEESGAGAEGSSSPEAPPEPATDLFALALRLEREIRDDCRTRLLHRGGRRLNRLTGGRILGLEAGRGEDDLALVDGGGSAGMEAEEDRAAAVVALRMALAELLAEEWSSPGSFLLGDPFDRMGEEDQLRALSLLRRVLSRVPQIILLTRGAVVERAPEFFDGLFEFREGGEGGTPILRTLPAGVGVLKLR